MAGKTKPKAAPARAARGQTEARRDQTRGDNGLRPS